MTNGRKCIFPFTYKNREYHDCTWDWAFHEDRNNIGHAWCGTSHDDSWGGCGDGCSIPGRKHSLIIELPPLIFIFASLSQSARLKGDFIVHSPLSLMGKSTGSVPRQHISLISVQSTPSPGVQPLWTRRHQKC